MHVRVAIWQDSQELVHSFKHLVTCAVGGDITDARALRQRLQVTVRIPHGRAVVTSTAIHPEQLSQELHTEFEARVLCRFRFLFEFNKAFATSVRAI